ncbi:hypothetical protein [Sorangium sp. So ce542]|uniref:hypothetical protein n=1 Tax=Sorangium sp. So ce542 TaxID=3133316 RepID=UPI003F6061DC
MIESVKEPSGIEIFALRERDEGSYASSDSEDEFEFFTREYGQGTSIDDYVHLYLEKYEGADLDERELFSLLAKSDAVMPFAKPEATISTTLNSNSDSSRTVLDRRTDAYFGTELTFTCPGMLAFNPDAMKGLDRAKMIQLVAEEELKSGIQEEARKKQLFLLRLYQTLCDALPSPVEEAEEVEKEEEDKKKNEEEDKEKKKKKKIDKKEIERQRREQIERQALEERLTALLLARAMLASTKHEGQHEEQLAELLLDCKQTLDAEAAAEIEASNPKNVPASKLKEQRDKLRDQLNAQRERRLKLEKIYEQLRERLGGDTMPKTLDVERLLALLAYKAEFDQVSRPKPDAKQLAWERQLALVIAYEELWVEKLPLFLGTMGTVKRKPPNGRELVPHRVRFAEGVANRWWYDISHDVPCIELSTRRMTWKQSAALADVMQLYIFDFAKDVLGLTPHVQEGGGHIHIDLSTGFKNNPKLLLNFMTDIHNLGVWPFLNLGFMKKVAPPLSCQPKRARSAYAMLLQNAGKLSVPEIVTAIQRDVYGGAMDDKTVHNQLIGLRSLESRMSGLQRRWARKAAKDDRRKPKGEDYLKVASLEIRAFRPQQSAAEVVLILKLLQRRLRATKREELVKYTGIELPVKDGWIHLPGEGGVGEKQWAQAAQAIVLYFAETSLPIGDYVHFFPEEVREAIRRYAS